MSEKRSGAYRLTYMLAKSATGGAVVAVTGAVFAALFGSVTAGEIAIGSFMFAAGIFSEMRDHEPPA